MPAPKLPPQTKKCGRPPIPYEPPVRRSRKQDLQIRRYQQGYYGLVINITKCLDREIPSHSQNPLLIDKPFPSHHRKMCPLTKVVLDRAIPSVPKEDVNPFYASPQTDITETLKIHPPSHAMHKDASDTFPWFGLTRTSVTDPRVDDFSVNRAESQRCKSNSSKGTTGRSKSSLGNHETRWSKETKNSSKPRCVSSLGLASSELKTSPISSCRCSGETGSWE